MSKVSKITEQAMNAPFANKREAITHAEYVLSGKRTISREEATKLFGEAGDVLDVQFTRMDHNMKAVALAQLQVSAHARSLISESKDIAAKVGDAMARIDKVMVKDFEIKLCQLERFVSAMQSLDELKRNGRLDSLVAAFAKV